MRKTTRKTMQLTKANRRQSVDIKTRICNVANNDPVLGAILFFLRVFYYRIATFP